MPPSGRWPAEGAVDKDGQSVAVFFRDLRISDLIDFEYSGTPTAYLERFPDQRKLDSLWPGSWFSPDYATWIGEPEETLAWTYLERVRRHLARYDIQKREAASPKQLSAALESMYLAEGSDWFWWYGADQDSGVDEYFDEGFRALLSGVYTALGDEVPDFLRVPIIPERPIQPEQSPRVALSVAVDGVASPREWDDAGYLTFPGGAMARADQQVSALYYGFDPDQLLFRIESRSEWSTFGGSRITVYFSLPQQEFASPVSRAGTVLGFRAGYAMELDVSDGSRTLYQANRFGEWDTGRTAGTTGLAGRTVEIGVGFDVLGYPQPGDAVVARATVSNAGGDISLVPDAGPVRMIIPDLGTSTVVLAAADPAGDDHGPGSYTYPTDPVFLPGSYDIRSFTVAENDQNVIFTFQVAAEIANPWGSGIGLSVQTFDVYIDADSSGATGARDLLEGRNAHLPDDAGWDAAVWVEGWNQKLLVPDEDGHPVELPGNPVRAVVDGPNGTVAILVPRASLADALGVAPGSIQPDRWSYAAVVLSQEGFPSTGVRRVRDVNATASQWRLGGAPGGPNDTRIVDVVIPNGAARSQEQELKDGIVPLLNGTM